DIRTVSVFERRNPSLSYRRGRFHCHESCSCERRKLERAEKTVQPGDGDERSVRNPGHRPVYRPEQSARQGEQGQSVLEEAPPRERLIDDAITASFSRTRGRAGDARVERPLTQNYSRTNGG